MQSPLEAVAHAQSILDDYDRDAADAAEQGEIWPHDPGTEVDVPVWLLRALLAALTEDK